MRFLLVALLAMTPPSAFAQQTPGRIDVGASHKRQGLSHLERGQFDRALVELRQAAAIDPADAIVHDGIGVALGELGDLEQAFAAFRRAIELAPDLAAPRFHLALALERSGHPRDALTSYQHAVRLKPDLIEARHGLGSVLAQLGDYDGAVAQFQAVTQAAPGVAEAHYNLGLSLWSRYKNATGPRRASDIEGARTALTTAARLAPSDPKAHAALGQLLADTDDLAAAVESLRRAQTLEPDNNGIAYDLGLALRKSGDLDGAEAQLRRALAGIVVPMGTSRALGLVLRQKDDLTGAAAAFAAATQTSPEDAQAHQLLGSTLIKLSRVDEGLRALDRAIELDPRLGEAWIARAQVFAREGQAELARRDQAEAQRIKSVDAAVGRAMILIESGQGHARAGHREAAIAGFREATTVCPELSEAHYQLGVALMDAPGESDAAVAALQRALDLDASRADAHYRLGLLRAKKGDDQHAAELFSRAIALKPSLVDAHRAMAESARARRDWSTVIAELEAVLAWQPGDARARDERAAAIDAQTREEPCR